jgi:hypothetical protein
MTKEMALKLPTGTRVVFYRPGNVNHGDTGQLQHDGILGRVQWDDGCALSFGNRAMRYVREVRAMSKDVSIRGLVFTALDNAGKAAYLRQMTDEELATWLSVECNTLKGETMRMLLVPVQQWRRAHK